MKLLKPTSESAPYQLRGMATLARVADSGLAQPQQAILDAVQRVIFETEIDLEALEPITPQDLADHVESPAHARQVIRLMVVISIADGPPSMSQVSLLREFANELGVVEPAVDVIHHLAQGRVMRFRIAFARRSHVRTYLRNTRKLLGGVLPTIRALMVARGVLSEDQAGAARYRALALLPEETLGRRFYEHCVQEELPFSGEKGGFPIGALFHDFSHVLANYDTSPEGEIKNAAFQAGFTGGEEDFFTALFALVIHTAGVNLTPFPMPVDLGRIGRGTLAVDLFEALERGAAMKVDLSSDWDFWDYVELPIEEARVRLGIPPLKVSAGVH